MKQRYNVFDTFGLRALNKCVTWVKFVLKQLSAAISLAFFASNSRLVFYRARNGSMGHGLMGHFRWVTLVIDQRTLTRELCR